MTFAVLYITTLLVAFTITAEVSPDKFNNYDYESLGAPEDVPNMSDNEYIRHIHAMIDAYRGDTSDRMVIETNALINTKYRTWKRNADLINSLLALPKGMNDAGRR